MSKFIILCGGTGGHLAPGLAVGQALIDAGDEASFVISQKEVDSRLVRKYSNLHIIKAPGVAFSLNPARFCKFLSELAKSVRFGRKVISEGKYDAVISFGGFNSLGFSIAARSLGVPLILHEANRRAGKATRLLGRFAERIYVPYGVRIPRRKGGQVKYSGYPVRSEIKKLPKSECRRKFGFPDGGKLLLVLGGSQGALALNEWAFHNFDRLAEKGINVLCVCGQGKKIFSDRTVSTKEFGDKKISFLEFCDDMASAMSAADVAVARAGAGTIAELARCRLPSVIVPYPFAADNHQRENARCFEKQGGCAVIEQDDLNRLFDEVIWLMENEGLRRTMEENLARVDALNDTSKIIDDLKEIARKTEVG